MRRGVVFVFVLLVLLILGWAAVVVAVSDAGLPAAHVGMAAGPVIERDGDYYGRTVNLASRLADVADAGKVVVNTIASMTAAGIGSNH
jgi:hypothetical protein